MPPAAMAGGTCFTRTRMDCHEHYSLKWLATLMRPSLLAGCGASSGGGPEAELVGVYAVKRDGELKELIKIERQGDRYVMRDKVRTAEWSEPKMQMQPVTREQLVEDHDRHENTAFVGVASEQLAYLQGAVGVGEERLSDRDGVLPVLFAWAGGGLPALSPL
jgi:hypothetical protein